MSSRFYWTVGLVVFAGSTVYNSIQQDKQIKEISQQVAEINKNVAALNEVVLERTSTQIKYNEKDVDCLTRNIYYEAGVEDTMGKYAVAQVTLNRVKTGKWGKSICQVVYARKQFSWTAKKKRAWSKPKGKTWDESKAIAHKVLAEGIRVRPLKKSLFYYADYIQTPKWVDHTKFSAQIGQHLFYTQAKGSSIKV